MHAVVRRMPAERARHPKRLGHVQTGSGPVPVLAVNENTSAMGTTIVTTQQTTTPATSSATSASSSTSTSTNSSPSSALRSILPTQSPPAPSSAATSPTLSAASSVSTQSPPVTAPSSSLVTPSNPSTFTFPTSSSTPISQANGAAASKSGLSGGAIAGIIAGAVIVGTAFIVFFIKKTYLRRRERKHLSWIGAPGLDEPKLFQDASEHPASSTSTVDTSQRSAPLSPFQAYVQPIYSAPVPPVAHMHRGIPTYATPLPPPATYNNPAAYPTQPIPSTYNPGSSAALAMGRVPVGTSTLPAVRAQHMPMEAIVGCTFVPTLPDELSITTGERIFIVEQYDDGWNLCANGRGERGVVPRECLEHALFDQPDVGWGNMKRISSLNPDDRRF